MEYFSDFGVAHDGLAQHRRQASLDDLLHVIEDFVDHAVVAHLHAGGLARLLSARIQPHVEADHGSLRRGRQVDVGFGDAANPG